MAKQLLFEDQARAKMLRGINKLADAVAITMGPTGRNVIIEKSFGGPTVTKDGVSVSKEIELEDRFENMGAKLVNEVADKTSSVAGDGTTTATVLARAIFAEGTRLIAAGYEHYEISSYARPGHRAVHNSSYWRLAEFLGVGNGAASFRRLSDGTGVRWTNPRSVGRYLAGGEPEVEPLSANDLASDRIWLGMRTAEGVENAAFSGRKQLLRELLRDGLAVDADGRIRPTLRGFLLSDSVARRAVGG